MYTTGGRGQVIFSGGLKIFWREKGNRKILKGGRDACFFRWYGRWGICKTTTCTQVKILIFLFNEWCFLLLMHKTAMSLSTLSISIFSLHNNLYFYPAFINNVTAPLSSSSSSLSPLSLSPSSPWYYHQNQPTFLTSKAFKFMIKSSVSMFARFKSIFAA